MADEEGVPGVFGDDPRRQAVIFVCAGVKILDEKVLVGGEGAKILEELIELLSRHLFGVVPPDRAFGLAVGDDKFIVRGTAGVLASYRHERAAAAQATFTSQERDFDEFGLQLVGDY